MRLKAAAVSLCVCCVAALGLAPAAAHAFTVNVTGDAGDQTPDGVCDRSSTVAIDCSLREAIQEANATVAPDTIDFGIPSSGRAGVRTITPASPLPYITAPATIDAYTQPGASVNTSATATNAKLMIELDGKNVTTDATLVVAAPGSVVRGLVINDGVTSLSLLSSGITIAGCFIGTDAAGLAANGPDFWGILVSGDGATIGGPDKAARNLIAGARFGVAVNPGADSALVQGNLIGTDRHATGALGTTQGGVWANGDGTEVVQNTIAFNGSPMFPAYGDGVTVGGATTHLPQGVRIQNNSIFGNMDLGIDLWPNGEDANDALDADQGPNGLQNKPLVDSAVTQAGVTTIAGRLKSVPGKKYKIELYSNPTGTQATKLIGSTSVTTNAQGGSSFTFSPANAVAVGERITATATAPDHSTSEISGSRLVAAG